MKADFIASGVRELQTEFHNKVRQLQANCEHTNKEHSHKMITEDKSYNVLVCLNCGKTLKEIAN